MSGERIMGREERKGGRPREEAGEVRRWGVAGVLACRPGSEVRGDLERSSFIKLAERER